MATADVRIRRATHDDLSAAVGVWYATELADEPDLPPLTLSSEVLRHDVEHGDMFVAERAGAAVGFATSFVREGVRFMSNLFVHPHAQNSGIGRSLLECAVPHDGLANCTMSSKDPRAQALYVRHGMAPRWPHVLLHADTGRIELRDGPGIRVVAADPSDTELLAWDAGAAGRARPQDLEHLVADLGAEAVWFELNGRRAGYGLVQRRSPFSLRHPEQAAIGPVGVRRAEDAAPCVLAAIRHAARDAGRLAVSVPGPHPALPELLRAGFRIGYVELFMATAEVVDPTRYLASGSEVF